MPAKSNEINEVALICSNSRAEACTPGPKNLDVFKAYTAFLSEKCVEGGGRGPEAGGIEVHLIWGMGLHLRQLQ